MATYTRNRFSTRGGSPLRATVLVDPFASMISNMHQDLQRLQDQKALDALANGDPDGFLAYAEQTASKRTGEEAAMWQSLVDKAYNKIDEDKWAAITKDHPEKLEDFYNHLGDKLDGLAAGSDAAYQLIQTMNEVQKSITARDESISDQKALVSYVGSKDHIAYAKYLSEKLARTTDPKIAATLQNNIDELRNRQATDDQVKRTQTRMSALTDYLEGGGRAADAIAKLQDLALDKNITATEVSAIQTLVTQIHDREDAKAAKAASAAGSSTGVDVNAFNQNLAAYQDRRRAVDQALANGQKPTDKQLNDLASAASILHGQYNTAAQFAASNGKLDVSSKYQTDAGNIDDHLQALPAAIDKMLVKTAVTTSADDFTKNLATITDPGARADAISRRLERLAAVVPQLSTEGQIGTVQSEMTELGATARKTAADVFNGTNADFQKKDLDTLNAAYDAYKNNPNFQHTGAPISKLDFISALVEAKTSTNPEEATTTFAQKVGLSFMPGAFGIGQDTKQFSGVSYAQDANGQKPLNAQESVTALIDLASRSGIVENQVKAQDIWKKLLMTPGAVPFGPPGSPEFEQMGLTSMDILEMRRGAGLIKGGRPAQSSSAGQDTSGMYAQAPGMVSDATGADLTSYETSGLEMRQEIQKQRSADRKAQLAQAPSIEDSLLQPLAGIPAFQMGGNNFDPGQGDVSQFMPSMNQSAVQPEQNPDEAMWKAAQSYTEQPTDLQLPGFGIPALTDNSPVLASPDSGGSMGGSSDVSGPAFSA